MTPRTETSGPKHEQVYRGIMDLINTGAVSVGGRLPTETELAREYSVSRSAVRHAFRRLKAEGILEKKAGCSACVAHGPDAAATRSLLVNVRSTSKVLTPDGSAWAMPLYMALRDGAAVNGIRLLEEAASPGAAFEFGPPHAGVSAVIVMACATASVARLCEGVEPDFPIVVVNRPSSDPMIPSICVDHEHGVHAATAFLLSLGHQRIAFNYGGENDFPTTQRLAGFGRAHIEAGIELDHELFCGCSGDEKHLWPDRLRQVLRMPNRPTALLMSRPLNVLHILEVLQGERLRVPEDISLIMIDDASVLQDTTPEVSCIRQPLEEMGRKTIDMVVDLFSDHRKRPQIRLRTELIMRNSVALPPA